MCSIMFHYVPFRSWTQVDGGALTEHSWNLNGAVSEHSGTQMEHGHGRQLPGLCRAGGGASSDVRTMSCTYYSTGVRGV